MLNSSPDGCCPFNAFLSVQFIETVAASDLNYYVPFTSYFWNRLFYTSDEAMHKRLIIMARIYIIQKVSKVTFQSRENLFPTLNVQMKILWRFESTNLFGINTCYKIYLFPRFIWKCHIQITCVHQICRVLWHILSHFHIVNNVPPSICSFYILSKIWKWSSYNNIVIAVFELHEKGKQHRKP